MARPRTGHLYRRGGVWWIQYRLNGEVFRQSLGVDTKDDAEKKAAAIMAPFTVASKEDILATVHGRLSQTKEERAEIESKANPPLAIAKAWRDFLAAPNRPDTGPATLAQYEGQWHLFADWLAKNHKEAEQLQAVSREIANEYAAHLTGRKLTPNTFNKHVRLLSLVFRILRRQAQISENPWSEIERKKLKTFHRRELTIEELRRVCAAAKGELRRLLALGVYTGARLGDAVTLDWKNVDLVRGFIRYTPRKTARQSGRVLTVPIHPTLAAILAETPESKRRGRVLRRFAKLYEHGAASIITNEIKQHFETCEIVTNQEGRGKNKAVEVGFHSLRHTAISMLREAGNPLSVTMGLVGHSSLAVHDSYSHAGEAAMKSAIASMPTLIGEPVEPLALPAPKDTAARDAQLRKIVEGMDAKTWTEAKKKLLAMFATKDAGDQT